MASLTEGSWHTFNTSGDLIMHWSFADRNGDLAINNFDSRSYGTGAHGLSQPSLNINQFGGALTQSGGPSIRRHDRARVRFIRQQWINRRGRRHGQLERERRRLSSHWHFRWLRRAALKQCQPGVSFFGLF